MNKKTHIVKKISFYQNNKNNDGGKIIKNPINKGKLGLQREIPIKPPIPIRPTASPQKIAKTVTTKINMNYNRYKVNKLGIIVVNLNNLSYTQNLLIDLKKQINPNFHIHIYDQNSDEVGTNEFLDSLKDDNKITIVKNDSNVPLNHLWNNFVRENDYQYFCFLNNDISLTNNFVDDTIKALDNNKDVGVVIHPTNNLSINKSKNTYELKILENPPLYQGWDFSFRREAFEYIPTDMLIFGGDDFIFANVINKGYRIGMTMSSPIIHYKERTRVKISNIQQIQNNDSSHYWKEMKIRGLKHVDSTMNTELSNRYPPKGMKLVQNKNCIYTAVIGDYDTLFESNVDKKDNWDYICFTDNADLKSKFWRVVYIGNNKKDVLLNYKLARFFKTNFQKYLSSYDNIIWKDARCVINCDLDKYLSLMGNNDILFSNHPSRKNISQEMDAILSGKLEDIGVINKIKEKYKADGYNYKNGLMSSGLLCFKNNSKVIDFFNDWWLEIENYSYRDQLSLNYVLSKHPNIKYHTLNFFSVFNGYFKQGKRKSPRLTF